MDQKKVVVGGTFDLLHEGHKALLRKAFDLAKSDLQKQIRSPEHFDEQNVLGGVWIGLVSEEMAKKTKSRPVGIFEGRKKELADFIEKEIGKPAAIFKIDDKLGFTLKEDFDYIVVSPETYENALEINIERKKINKKPIEIIKIDHILAEDKKPISSTRIYNGEINREGKIITRQCNPA